MSAPAVVVCYDVGSASPVEIWRAASGVCRPVFVYDRDTEGGKLAAVMGALAPTVDATGRDDDDVAEELRALAPAGITTFSEYQIRRTAALAARLGLGRYHAPEVAERLTDKWAQREAVRRAGVDHVRSWPLTCAADLPAALSEVPLPAVVKPARGAGSRDTYRVDDAAECAAVVESLFAGGSRRTFVLEEMLVGDSAAAGPDWSDHLSVETLFLEGAPAHVALSGRTKLAHPFRETGAFVPSSVGPELGARIVRLTERVCAALGVRHGFTHTEIKLTAGGPRLLEVNGRLGGHVPSCIRRSLGVDPVALALRAAVGAVESVPDVRRPGCVAFDYFPAVPVEARRVVAVAGLDEIQHLPGVEHVELRVQPGASLDWRVGSEGYVCSVAGAVATHDELRRTLSAIDALLRVTYDQS
jgi:biotin carboxylase